MLQSVLQLLRLSVLGVQLKCLCIVVVCFLELEAVIVPQRQIVRGFEIGMRSMGFLSVVDGRIDVTLPAVDDCYVIKSLCVVGSI